MKILIVSDLHLEEFDIKKFIFLNRIFSRADQVILNGDFWEGQTSIFTQFISSQWNKLFPILKQKHTVYIYGNHDKENLNNNQTQLFSDIQTKQYKIKINNKTYIFEHGNRLCYFYSYRKLFKVIFSANRLADLLEKLVITLFNKRFFQFYCKRYNEQIKRKLKLELKENQFYICGHTHLSEIDLNNHFANSGFIKYGYGSYLIINNGELELHEEHYN